MGSGSRSERPFFASWLLIGGVLFVALHSVSDIGIYALLAASGLAHSQVGSGGSPSRQLRSCSCRRSVPAASPHRSGLALDVIGFVLLLVFVAATSVVGLMRTPSAASATLPPSAAARRRLRARTK